MGQVLHLMDVHMYEEHPDHQAIRDWFKANDIDDTWVVVPSHVKVNTDAIIVWEYLHNSDGTVLLDRNTREHAKAPIRYECTPTPLPTFSDTEVS